MAFPKALDTICKLINLDTVDRAFEIASATEQRLRLSNHCTYRWVYADTGLVQIACRRHRIG
ncbi:MAG: hypothetical protein R2880_11105 [Deinococcales bacterium]